MDLLSVLPDFPTKSYSHILPPLERKHISTADLITLDTLEIAKRAHVPPADVRRLSADVVAALHASLGYQQNKEDDQAERKTDHSGKQLDLSRWKTISTLDATLDELLGGGIPTGYLTEITGERYSPIHVSKKTNKLTNYISVEAVKRSSCSTSFSPHNSRRRTELANQPSTYPPKHHYRHRGCHSSYRNIRTYPAFPNKKSPRWRRCCPSRPWIWRLRTIFSITSCLWLYRGSMLVWW